MNGGMKHPFTRALYTCTPEGNIRVESDGKTGLFQSDGQWIEGELREADPQFCGWIAGDKVQQAGGRVHGQ